MNHFFKTFFAQTFSLYLSSAGVLHVINVVCCVGRVEIQIEIKKGWCTADTNSKV